MDHALRSEILSRITMPKLRVEKALIVTEAYKETEGQPMILRRAKALREILLRIPIQIEDWQLVVGSPSAEPFTVSPNPEASWRWVLTELDALSTRDGDKYLVAEEDKRVLKETLQWWRGKSIEEGVLDLLPPEVVEAFENGLIDSAYVSQGSGNFSQNYGRILAKGFLSVQKEIEERRSRVDVSDPAGQEKSLYYQAALICCEAMIAHSARYAVLARKMAREETREARKRELELIADHCERVPAHPARDFFEALQSFWFTHALVHIEVSGGGGVVAGRLDQTLYPYFKQADKPEAKRWLENLWINYNQIRQFLPKRASFIWSGNPIAEQPTIGGVNEKEEDASNELTELMLEVDREVALPQPDIALMYHKKINEEVLEKACETLLVTAKPKFFNYEVARDQVLAKGATPEDVRKGLVTIGCVTSGIEGQIWGNNMIFLNLGKCLELALNEGMDPLSGKQIGCKSGTPARFSAFDDVLTAFKNQLRHAVGLSAQFSATIEKVHGDLNPQPLASLFIDDHLEKGLPPWKGGSRLSIQGIAGVGFATVIDSLAAIETMVFDERSLEMTDLMEALRSNFEGKWEERRHRLLNLAPKFGNDDDKPDRLAAEIADFYCGEVRKYNCRRDVPYYPSLYSVSAHLGLGQFVGATPNGRKAGRPLSDGMSPSQGACFNGPTAVIRSMTKIDHSAVLNGTLLNMKLNGSFLKGVENRKKFIALLKTFMELGGYHVQFNFIDRETLKEAQVHPEKYQDLLVRVAAYVAQFVQLPRDLQEDIINRTELGQS
jgi:pyruvate formate-lyase/glycerol dehydratase family glycyl radical enzyme